ncbi:HNH endonuclease [Paenibacillus azoreducens]|uniref:HNH endonuclease n=1 Tax=Paenibacillus azoreducens TaxID=116718 RepID=A0A919YGN5_9BACL|nr:HNH endonuclease [Paenibacillus azoreducens]
MMVNDFYKSTSWKRKRKKILRRDVYVCRESRRYGKTEPATTVHHIYPLEFYPELALEDWNLISLCEKQHNAMHDRVTHEITELGRQWQERVRPQFEEWMENNKRGDTQHS